MRNMTISGLAIAPGSLFQLRFTITPGAGGGAAPGDVFVNEFHYDNTGGDVGEFVEIVAGPDFQQKLSEIDVLFYNGSNGEIYQTLNLAGPEFTRTTTANAFELFTAELGSSVQNGPDGIALVNRTTNEVIHFLSYEGVFAGSEGSALGIPSTNIGVSQTGSEAVGASALGLTGSGGVRTNFTWSKIAGPYSKGAVNAGQTLVNPALPSQGIAIDNLAVTFLTGGDTDGDGFTDADEIVFGTNPADAASRFVVNFANQTPTPGMVRLSFPTMTGRSYAVESCTDFSDWEVRSELSWNGRSANRGFPGITRRSEAVLSDPRHASIAVGEGRDEGDAGALEGVGKRVVAVGLEIGGDEKLAGAAGGSGDDDLGGILRVAECPADGDGVGEFLRTKRVEAGAADGAVFDAA